MLKIMAHLSTRRDRSLARVRIVVYTSLPAGLRPFLPNKLIGSSIVVSWIPDELPGGRSAVAAHQFVFLGRAYAQDSRFVVVCGFWSVSRWPQRNGARLCVVFFANRLSTQGGRELYFAERLSKQK